MKIGDLARAVGCSTSAIRYYEQAGLISCAARKNGIRDFGPIAIDELKLLRFYRNSGFTIRQLTAVARQQSGSEARYEAWNLMVQARIDELDARIREAQQIRGMLEEVIACRCVSERSVCVVRRFAASA